MYWVLKEEVKENQTNNLLGERSSNMVSVDGRKKDFGQGGHCLFLPIVRTTNRRKSNGIPYLESIRNKLNRERERSKGDNSNCEKLSLKN